MGNRILRFPDGVTGAALLLIRLSYAPVAFPSVALLCPGSLNDWPSTIPAAILSMALATGFGTRAAAALLLVVLGADLFVVSTGATFLLVACTGGAGGLVLLGPGAYSVDAHWFGRRVIRLDRRSPDRGRGR